MIDITKTTEPKSDQLNYDDVMAHTLTVTVSEVKKGSAEQPVEIHLVEFPGRPFKPSKSMRRVLVAAWGGDAAPYVGRRMTLYGDPTVKFGGAEVGGIRISHLSHIPEPVTVQLTVTRAKRAPFTVQPLASVEDAAGWISAAQTMDELQRVWAAVKAMGLAQDADLVAMTNARKQELA